MNHHGLLVFRTRSLQYTLEQRESQAATHKNRYLSEQIGVDEGERAPQIRK